MIHTTGFSSSPYPSFDSAEHGLIIHTTAAMRWQWFSSTCSTAAGSHSSRYAGYTDWHDSSWLSHRFTAKRGVSPPSVHFLLQTGIRTATSCSGISVLASFNQGLGLPLLLPNYSLDLQPHPVDPPPWSSWQSRTEACFFTTTLACIFSSGGTAQRQAVDGGALPMCNLETCKRLGNSILPRKCQPWA